MINNNNNKEGLMTIKYLELNPREKHIFNNATVFSVWSKNTKQSFTSVKSLEMYAKKLIVCKPNTKFLVYAVMDNTDACIGTIN